MTTTVLDPDPMESVFFSRLIPDPDLHFDKPKKWEDLKFS